MTNNMTIDTQQLAADIATVLELDAKCLSSQNAFENSVKNTWLEIDRNLAKNELRKAAPLMASIIRRQQELLWEARSVLGEFAVEIDHRDSRYKFDSDKFLVGKATTVLARIAPLLKGTTDDK